jgi:hypothetical protein
MTLRSDLHHLIDALPEERLSEVSTRLAGMPITGDPFLDKFLRAPDDDEPLTPAALAAMAEAEEDIRRGDVERWEDVRRRRQAARAAQQAGG